MPYPGRPAHCEMARQVEPYVQRPGPRGYYHLDVRREVNHTLRFTAVHMHPSCKTHDVGHTYVAMEAFDQAGSEEARLRLILDAFAESIAPLEVIRLGNIQETKAAARRSARFVR